MRRCRPCAALATPAGRAQHTVDSGACLRDVPVEVGALAKVDVHVSGELAALGMQDGRPHLERWPPQQAQWHGLPLSVGAGAHGGLAHEVRRPLGEPDRVQ